MEWFSRGLVPEIVSVCHRAGGDVEDSESGMFSDGSR